MAHWDLSNHSIRMFFFYCLRHFWVTSINKTEEELLWFIKRPVCFKQPHLEHTGRHSTYLLPTQEAELWLRMWESACTMLTLCLNDDCERGCYWISTTHFSGRAFSLRIIKALAVISCTSSTEEVDVFFFPHLEITSLV